ncbi:MAG: phosphatidylglycerophosphatase A [Candidatus Omnitrophota bacterium]
MQRAVKLITSVFYLGHIPVMPGTMGSLGALWLYYAVKNNISAYIITTAVIFLAGIFLSSLSEKIYGKKDPKEVVIDEACGMMLSLIFLPYSIWIVITGFFLFRLFDIIKPPPLRKMEALPGAFGIMLDDIAAAIYTNIILQILTRIFHLT